MRQHSKIDMFLVTNDTRIYSSQNLRFLLEDLYRQGIPVVALNKHLLNAGAAISITPNQDAFVKQTAVLAERLSQAMPIEPFQFAQEYQIEINESLVRRYSLNVKSFKGVAHEN